MNMIFMRILNNEVRKHKQTEYCKYFVKIANALKKLISDQKKNLAFYASVIMLSACYSPLGTQMDELNPTKSVKVPTTTLSENDSKVVDNNLLDFSEDEILEWLILSWEENKDPTTIYVNLLNSGWLADTNVISFFNNLNVNSFFEADITNSKRHEWVVALLDHDHRYCQWGLPCQGKLVIIGEKGLLYELKSESTAGWSFPIATGDFDLTSDTLKDIIVTSYRVSPESLLTSIHVLSNETGQIENIIRQDNNSKTVSSCLSNLISNNDWNATGLFLYQGQLEVKIENSHQSLQLVYSGLTKYNPESNNWECKQREYWEWNGDAIVLTKVENPP